MIKPSSTGALDGEGGGGAPMSHVDFIKRPMLHVTMEKSMSLVSLVQFILLYYNTLYKHLYFFVIFPFYK